MNEIKWLTQNKDTLKIKIMLIIKLLRKRNKEEFEFLCFYLK